ncbi:OmpA family protein [Shimia sagamensis]|uniref:OmpA-OmpF porin, OOP family n=1 Tax=Shimia sagamensis TaxID=1566352 RepID=A0ABY1N5N1_9RHOB|nr:OmpA family protein [Shimia sagamensis]SMP00831.1 OmpA-OmpF porin, OOP family [Shimia sagamensis]
MKSATLITWLLLCPATGWAFEPRFETPGQLLGEEFAQQSVLSLAIEPADKATVPTIPVAGTLRKRSWRFSSGFPGTGRVNSDLAAQLLDEGYELILSCDATACGGFDFRFGIDVLLPPNMFVDLSDYFYLSAHRETDAGPEAVAVLVSRTAQAGMVQVFDIRPDSAAAPVPTKSPKANPQPQVKPEPETTTSTLTPVVSTTPETATDVATTLAQSGHVVLSDLSFETGASKLTNGDVASLAALADFLKDDPNRRIALVGHTDSKGSLATNTSLSQKRAAAVRAQLINQHGVRKSQIEARGAGYLAPIATNLTEAGRTLNRRVEAVLLSGS